MGVCSSGLANQVAKTHKRHGPGSDDDSDDEENLIDDVVARPRNRKMSVSAATYSEKQLQAEMEKNRRGKAKSTQEQEKIIEMCKNSVIFSHLGNDELKSLTVAFVARQHKAGEVIIHEGDDGDNVYIIDEGEITIFVASNTGSGQGVQSVDWSPSPQRIARKCKHGEIFGELALMYNAPRAATCISATPVKLWALERQQFSLIMRESTQKKRQTHHDFVSKVPILSELTKYERLTVADALKEEFFKKGEVVLRQGEAGDKFYIIKKGVAICAQQEQVIAELGQGEHFGEIALLTPKPRQATVTAQDKLVVLTMDRATFRRVMGPLKDILNRHIGGYENYIGGDGQSVV